MPRARFVEGDGISRVKATALPSNIPDIGNQLCQPRHFNFPKNLLVRKTCTVRLVPRCIVSLDGSGYIIIVRRFVSNKL